MGSLMGYSASLAVGLFCVAIHESALNTALTSYFFGISWVNRTGPTVKNAAIEMLASPTRKRGKKSTHVSHGSAEAPGWEL